MYIVVIRSSYSRTVWKGSPSQFMSASVPPVSGVLVGWQHYIAELRGTPKAWLALPKGRSRVQVQVEVGEAAGGCCADWNLCGHNPPVVFINFVMEAAIPEQVCLGPWLMAKKPCPPANDSVSSLGRLLFPTLVSEQRNWSIPIFPPCLPIFRTERRARPNTSSPASG